MVVPTPFVAHTLAPVVDKFLPGGILVSCTKGILNDTLETRESTRHTSLAGRLQLLLCACYPLSAVNYGVHMQLHWAGCGLTWPACEQ
jgi:hypothetical protein